VSLSFRKSLCLSPRASGAKREADEWREGLITHQVGERFSLSPGERAGVRASVELTFSANARRERKKKNGRKVVASGNDLARAQTAKKMKQLKD